MYKSNYCKTDIFWSHDRTKTAGDNSCLDFHISFFSFFNHIKCEILTAHSQSAFAGAAIVSGGKGTAQDKIKTLREAGVTVVESPAKIGAAMIDVFKQRGLVQ